MTGEQILIVEDDDETAAAVEAYLSLQGFTVATAANGQEAIDRLRGGLRPSLILLDLYMPVKDGSAFRAEQLADPELARIPVVVFSGGANLRDLAAGLGVPEYLAKPVDVDRLLLTVRRYCP